MSGKLLEGGNIKLHKCVYIFDMEIIFIFLNVNPMSANDSVDMVITTTHIKISKVFYEAKLKITP